MQDRYGDDLCSVCFVAGMRVLNWCYSTRARQSYPQATRFISRKTSFPMLMHMGLSG
jgi:hypothetical protein